MRRQRKAKIVATLGPASSGVDNIRSLAEAGADVFRMNFSHGAHEDHLKRLEEIRKVEEETGRPICVFMDLQGPKIRVSTFASGPVDIEAGQEFTFVAEPIDGSSISVHLPHPEVFAAVGKGDRLLLDDGKLSFEVLEANESEIRSRALNSGPLSDRKGMNLPDAVLGVTALTDKDRADLEFGLQQNIEWVALSFVQRPEDIEEARRLIDGRAKVIAKLEKPSAIERLEEVIELADAVMIARGDLGVELPPEKVPPLQKHIIAAARDQGKPVIVATQMLESMINAPTPTRAEASDVATAIFDGVDAVMLSAETAAGKYPREAVEMMDRIIGQVEGDSLYRTMMQASRGDYERTNTDAISSAAVHVAETSNATAIVTYSTTGKTTMRAARERPQAPILGLTNKMRTARDMCLTWGVHAVMTSDVKGFGEMVGKAVGIAEDEGFAGAGDQVVITAGVPFGQAGSTNILRIAKV